ncbi:acyl-CoA thioesterase [Terricaulis silvestris]|uniref:Acyl-CoA thioester hydrolase, YbgC/YbaW family n=1 Tax=Terricaulis silvestris TaxID=2686094 RepID=A0A6I6MTJ4_9CAUL|nr:thioesterase family protein [Terricaulis silvestris]QGZ95844.1 acyl-CoA thioester hydrolase, YbgC/YbaW family [Terricaulis silvestris]
MVAETFIQRFPVDAADIDELGHVNNIVYLRWAQDIATAHWRARAGAELVDRYVWVVLRHEADYRAALTLGDDVEVRTHVDDAPQGATWGRFVDIYKGGSEKPAVQIKSNWAMLDAKTRRVNRVPPVLVARFKD